jgi:hypothetical protein
VVQPAADRHRCGHRGRGQDAVHACEQLDPLEADGDGCIREAHRPFGIDIDVALGAFEPGFDVDHEAKLVDRDIGSGATEHGDALYGIKSQGDKKPAEDGCDLSLSTARSGFHCNHL